MKTWCRVPSHADNVGSTHLTSFADIQPTLAYNGTTATCFYEDSDTDTTELIPNVIEVIYKLIERMDEWIRNDDDNYDNNFVYP